MPESIRALAVAILTFVSISNSGGAGLDVTILSGSSSSIVNGLRDTTPIPNPRDTVMLMGGSDAQARYFFDNNTNLFRFGFNQAIHFKGSDIAVSTDGAFEFRLNEPAMYEFVGTNFWVGTTVEAALGHVAIGMWVGEGLDRPVYSEGDYVRASSGGIGLQEVGEGRPITVNFGKRKGYLEPGTYHAHYSFGLVDDLMDYNDDSEMHGYFAFYLTPIAESDVRPLLQEGIDFPVIETTGARGWSKSTVTTFDNVDSARSGAVGDGQRSTLKMGIPGPGLLQFWWKVSSETNADFLIFALDGEEQFHISGQSSWEQRTVYIPPNIHEIEFTYEKDGSLARGEDAGWVDLVTFEGRDVFESALPQNIRFEIPTRIQPFREPVRLDVSATSYLPVTLRVVSGPGVVQGNVLVPTGSGWVTVRAEQGGNGLFLPAQAERTFAVETARVFPLAANLPEMSAVVGGEKNRVVSKLAMQPDGKLIIGGYFDYVHGKRRGNIARFNANGTLDAMWRPRMNNAVTDMAILGDHVFVAGYFHEVNGMPRTNLAKLSLVDGSVDASWGPAANGTPMWVEAVGDDLLVGGGFSEIGGQTRWSVAKVSPQGQVDPLWNPIPDQGVQAVAVAGTNIYFAGDVLHPGGGTVLNLMRVSMEGTGNVDPGWKTPFHEVMAFALAANESYVVASGSFRSNAASAGIYGTAVFSAADGKLVHFGYPNDHMFSLEINGNAVYGGSRSGLSGISQTLKIFLDTFALDTNWIARTYLRNDGILPAYRILDLEFRGRDLFVAGDFDSLAGSPGSGVALLPALEGPPVVSPGITSVGLQTSSGLTIQPAAGDVIETTHFQITAIQNGTLFRQDGTTPIMHGAMITRAEAAAGLRFTPTSGFVGTGSFRVQASRSASASDVGGEMAEALITVLSGKLDQTITYEPIVDTPLSRGFVELRFTASSGLPITFTVLGPAYVTGNILTLTGVGEVTVLARQNGNEAYNPSLRVGQIFNVLKGNQTILFPGIEAARVGQTIALSASASSGLPVVFEMVSGPATLSDRFLVPSAAGTVLVRALQGGNDFYNAAPPVEQTIIIEPREQTIHFPAVPEQPFNSAGVRLQAAASSGLPVSYRVISGLATVADDLLRASGAGNVLVEAVQAGNAEYGPARAEQTVIFSKATQQITFEPIPFPLTMTSPPVVLRATASSGLPVHFWADSSNVTVVENIMTIRGPGRGFVYAQQPGDSNYVASLMHAQGFDIPKFTQVITNATAVRVPLHVGVVPLRAAASSGLPVRYRYVSGPATLSSNQLHLYGTGYVEVAATQSGNDLYEPANEFYFSVYVDPGSQTVQFQPLTDIYVGQSYPLVASASSGLPVTFAVRSGPGRLVSSNILLAVEAGTIVIAAWQPGNTNYNPSPEMLLTVEAKILKSAQSVSFAPLPDVRFSDGPLDLEATASSGLPVEFTVASGPGVIVSNRVIFTGLGRIAVVARQAGSELFEPALPVERSFAVSKGIQSIDFPPPPAVRYRSGPVTLNAAASSGLPVQFGVTAGPATISGNVLTLLGAGEVTLLALQNGNENYEAATAVERVLTVQKATQIVQFNPPREIQIGADPVALEASADSGLAVRFVILSGGAILNGNRLSPVAAGEVRIQAFQAGDNNFEPASNEQKINITEAAQPRLEVLADSTGFVIRWPAGFTNFSVEASNTLAPLGWSPAAENPAVVEGFWILRISPTTAGRFYRLKRGDL